ncbi:hypothetical protein ACET3Z_008016 [Daucus carota]
MKVVASVLLVLNLCMYVIILGIGGWEMNKSISQGFDLSSQLSRNYYPEENTATGLFLVFGLIAGCVGFASLISGLNHVCLWSNDTLPAAVSAATVAWAHTVLALGLEKMNKKEVKAQKLFKKVEK